MHPFALVQDPKAPFISETTGDRYNRSLLPCYSYGTRNPHFNALYRVKAPNFIPFFFIYRETNPPAIMYKFFRRVLSKFERDCDNEYDYG